MGRTRRSGIPPANPNLEDISEKISVLSETCWCVLWVVDFTESQLQLNTGFLHDQVSSAAAKLELNET